MRVNTFLGRRRPKVNAMSTPASRGVLLGPIHAFKALFIYGGPGRAYRPRWNGARDGAVELAICLQKNDAGLGNTRPALT